MIQRKHLIFLGIMAAALFGLLYWMLQPSTSNSTSIAKVEKDNDAVEQAEFQLIRFDRDVVSLGSGEFNAQYASLKKSTESGLISIFFKSWAWILKCQPINWPFMFKVF